MLKLKICGMKLPANIEEVSGLWPDYLGFIFFPGSPRHFSGVIPPVDPRIKKVGVFVNETPENISEKVETHKLQAVQLHGEESPEYCKNLRQRFDKMSSGNSIEILKVFSIGDQINLKLLKPYEGIVDYFLFDTLGKSRGGNGIAFNWELLLNYNSPTPFFLSGGIGLGETEAIKTFASQLQLRGKEQLFQGIDVNSCFESEPGLKDLTALKNFKIQLEDHLK